MSRRELMGHLQSTQTTFPFAVHCGAPHYSVKSVKYTNKIYSKIMFNAKRKME